MSALKRLSDARQRLWFCSRPRDLQGEFETGEPHRHCVRRAGRHPENAGPALSPDRSSKGHIAWLLHQPNQRL